MMAKILLLVLLCLTHQAFSGMILTNVTFQDPSTDPATPETSNPTTTDPSTTTDDSGSEQPTTGNTQETETPTETQTEIPDTTTTPPETEGPIVVNPQQPYQGEESYQEENSSRDDSKSEESSDEKKKHNKKSKVKQIIRDIRHNHHMSCKRVIGKKIFDLLAQERIHLVDFPKIKSMKSADRVFNLQSNGNYILTFTALTFAPSNDLNSASPILEVIINQAVHQVQLGFNQEELSFAFTGRKGANNVKLTLNGDSSSKIPAQTNLSEFQVTLQ